MWIDFHCHCLPGMDDGASDLQQSKKILGALNRQNVGTVVATPHFNIKHGDIESFSAKREKAHKLLQNQLDMSMYPKLVMGAEVYMTYGLSESDIRPLAIEGTNAILLEMPFEPLKNWVINEIEALCGKYKLLPIIAHVERYLDFFSDKEYNMLYSIGNAIFQINAEAFANYGVRKVLRGWSEENLRFLPGSDAHNTTHRAPRFDLINNYATKSKYIPLLQNFVLSSSEIGLDKKNAPGI